jgi:anti-sigma B factor antagonist
VEKLTSKHSSTPVEPTLEEEIPPFEMLTVRSDGEVTIAIHGDIDIVTAPQLWEHLSAAIPDATHRLVLDLRATTFIDSIGLTVFVRAFKRLRHQGTEFVLRSPKPNARQILNVSGLDRVMTIDDSSEA